MDTTHYEATRKIALGVGESIWHLLMEKSNFLGPTTGYESLHADLKLALLEPIASNTKIKFLLPAFPAKSANREKTYSCVPDLGEVRSLIELNELCKRISEVHSPGAEVIICSDGRVFNDLVGVQDKEVSLYSNELEEIVRRFGLFNLSFFDLEAATQNNSDYTEMREALESEYGSSIAEIRSSVKENTSMKNLFNGIHRFIKEDYYIIHNHLSRNQVDKLAKKIAYQVIQRSNAWGNLVSEKFPKGFRLSIHPQFYGAQKFPIKLLPGKDSWGTPWHRVPLVENGVLSLIRHCDAISLRSTLKLFKGRYAYFESAQK